MVTPGSMPGGNMAAALLDRAFSIRLLVLVVTAALPATTRAEPMIELISDPTGDFLRFVDTTAPGTVRRQVTISGLPTGWKMRAIDVRPSTGELYGLAAPDGIITSLGLYRIHIVTGVATIVGVTWTVAFTSSATADMDFDPLDDTLHVATGANAEYWLVNPDTAVPFGPVAQTLHYATGEGTDPPYVAGLAFDRNVAGSALRTLYGLDRFSAKLVRVGAVDSPPVGPDQGVVRNIGLLDAMIAGNPLAPLGNQLGLDVSPSGLAVASLTDQFATVGYLFTIDLLTGAATPMSSFGVSGLVDVAFPGPMSYYTVTPCRVVDTRQPSPGSPLVAGAPRVFAIAGECGISATARAVSLNIAVTAPTSLGYVTLYPAGTAIPTVSTINFAANATRTNNAIIPLGATGEIAAVLATGTAHCIIDVTGYME
jgi:hypothetical protein